MGMWSCRWLGIANAARQWMAAGMNSKRSKPKNAGWGKQARELHDADVELQVVQRHFEEQSWRPSEAKPFRSLIANLMVARGYARQQEANAVADAWFVVAGPAAAGRSRAGKVFRGVLQVFVDDATLMQELTFRKRKLVEELARRLPDHKIRDVRFKADVPTKRVNNPRKRSG